ncbi:hypothetical protein VNI00_016790 [Paramarasmius palmivorus]|uniref:Transmembrane protein n=1 Tax=Paramarasmius palmivorus TaxID=297713 RepID=A0AAW0BCG5_9AGAR
MESQALIEPNSQPQAQAEAQAVPAVADSSKPTKSATEVDKSRVPGIVNRLIHKYPIGAISLPFILLIDTYLLFSPHSAAFNDLLDLFFIWLLWVSFVLAICGNLRLIWIFFTSGLQGITSFSETDFITIVGGCAAFSGELLVFVLLMTLVLYVLPSEVFYLGLWGIYFVGTVKAFRMPTGNQKEDDVEGGEANEGKDKSKRHLRLDRESWISLWTSGFIMWNSAMLFCMLQFRLLQTRLQMRPRPPNGASNHLSISKSPFRNQ